MKPTAFLRSFLAIAGSAALTISYAHAAARFWDGPLVGGPGNAVSNGGTGTWSTGVANWDLAPSGTARVVWSTNQAVFGGTAGTVTLGTGVIVTGNGGSGVGAISFDTTGYIVDGTNTITLGAASQFNSLGTTFQSGVAIDAGAFALTLGNAGTSSIAGQISGTAAGNVTVGGGGTLTFSGTTSNYLGNFRHNGGTTVEFASIADSTVASSLGAGSIIELGTASNASATIKSIGTGTQSTNRTIALNTTVAGLTHTLDMSGTGTLTFTAATASAGSGLAKTLELTGSTAGTGIFQGTIINNTNTVSLLKSGTGTWNLTGANTYASTTTITGGTLDLGGGTAGGSLTSSGLNMNGGSFSYTRTGNTTQAFATTTINSTQGSISVAAGNVLNLGTVVRGVGGAFDFTNAGGGIVAANSGNNVGGIMPGFTLGDTWAVGNSTGVAISGLASYTLTSTALDVPASYTGFNMDVDSSQAPTGVITTNSLRFSTAAANTLTLFAGNNTITSGGILVGSGVGSNLSTITGGTLRGTASNFLSIIQNNISGGLTISSVIDNNTGATGLTKAGAGLLTLTSANTFTGTTTAGAGTLELTTALALQNSALNTSGTGTITLTGVTSPTLGGLTNNAAARALSAVITSGYGAVTNLTLNTPTGLTHTYSGAIADGAAGMTLTKTGAGTQVLSGTNTYSGGTLLNAGTLSTSANGNLGSGGGITVGGTSTWNMGPASPVTYNRDLAINAGTLTVLSGNAGKTITGILSGSGAIVNGSTTGFDFNNTGNTFTGAVTSGYQMSFASLGDSSNPINISGGVAAGGFVWTGGAKTFSLRPFTLNSTATFSNITNNGSGALTIVQAVAISGTAGARTLVLQGSNAGANNFVGNIADGTGSAVGLTKSGSGIWAVSGTNTYSGNTVNGFNNPAGTFIFQGMQSLSPNTNITQTHVGGSGGFALIKLLDDSATPAARSTVNLTFTNSNASQNSMQVFVGNNSVANGGTSASTQTNSTIQLGNRNFTQGGVGNVGGQSLIVTGANGYKLQLANLNINLQAAYASAYPVLVQADTAPLIVTGNVQQAAGSGGTTTLTLAGVATGSQISGNILNSADGTPRPLQLIKSNAGTWTLSGTNTYSGGTSITAGVLASGVAVQGFGAAGISIGGSGTLSMLNDSSVSFSNGVSAYAINNSASGATINVDRASGTGSNTITVGNLTTTSTAVTWQLNFTGANGVSLSAGTLTTPTAAAGSHTINNNIAGGGSLTLAGVTGGGTGATSTLIFGGTANTTVSGAITQVSTNQALTKTGAGTLTLGGTNAYTGTTTVSSGTLTLGVDDALSDSSNVVIGNGILSLAGSVNDTAGTLAVTNAASTLNLGSGTTLAFATGSPAWTGTLNLTGTFVSGASLRFGTTSGGLTAGQLSSILAPGFTGFGLDANGFLTATAATGGYAGWQSANGTAQTINLDHDGDGVSNGVEYFLFGPVSTTGFTALPGVTNTAGLLSVTFTKAGGYTGTYGTDFLVETSSTLTGAWTTETVGGTVTITGNDVKYTFPAGTRNFARLKVTGP